MTAMVWDDRLISQERAYKLSGNWEMTLDAPYLRCGTCDGNILKLPSYGKCITLDGLTAAVVRHMVMNHNYSLSGTGIGAK